MPGGFISRIEPLLQTSVEGWRDVITTNLEAPFFLARDVLPGMRKKRKGRIVNIASVYGSLAMNGGLYGLTGPESPAGPERAPAYQASKGALLNLTRDLAVAVAPWGVTVNSVSPGMFPLDSHGTHLGEHSKTQLLRQTPVGRFGIPDEVASAVRFLLRDCTEIT